MTYDPSNSIRKPIDLSSRIGENAVFNFFNAVYAWMCVGLAVTALTAWLVSQNHAMMQALFQRGVIFGMLIGTYLLVIVIQRVALQVSAIAGTALFLLYSAIIGAMLSSIFVVYQLPSIAGAFILTAGTFGAMSVYGFITKKDLTSIGSFLIMAFVGVFLAVLINIFLQSSALDWILTFAILALSIGLTAYHTQKLKNLAYQFEGNATLSSRMAIVGSLILYINFLNMFMSILRIMGKRR